MINICSSIRKRRTMLERGRIWLKLATLLVLVVLVWTMARWMRAEGDGGDLRLTAGGVQVLWIISGVLTAEGRIAGAGGRSWHHAVSRSKRGTEGQLFICPLPHNWARKGSSSQDPAKLPAVCDWSSLAALQNLCNKLSLPCRRSVPHKHATRVINDSGGAVLGPLHHHHHYPQYHYHHHKPNQGSNAKRQSGGHRPPSEKKLIQTSMRGLGFDLMEQVLLQRTQQEFVKEGVHVSDGQGKKVVMESAVQGQLIGPPVRIDVYYETLCPDSRSFVATQLMPAVNNFPPEVLQITLVPYGKASTREGGDTGYTFDCQHGPPECEGNKVHACAIAHNRKKDTRNIVRYVDCMIHNNRMPMEIGKKCNEELNFGSWDDIADCANGKEGSQLLAKYGDMTHALNPPVDFIPTVIINGKRSEMWKALKNLKAVVCDKYPFTPMERDQYC